LIPRASLAYNSLMLTFAAAVFFLIITPGPGVLSTAGVGSGYGVRAATLYVGGLWLGNNLVALGVVSGLTAAMLAEPSIRTVLLYASACYLLYLAIRIALAGSKIAFIERSKAPGMAGGLMLQVINPKCYAVNTTFFSGFAFLSQSPLAEIAIKFAIMNVIWIPIHFLWLAAGVSIRRLDLPHRIQFGINILMALSMLAVVALAALASW
jgi:threonine/homoserine/homoserine lactone efflux protein